jgi:hypothetical protein
MLSAQVGQERPLASDRILAAHLLNDVDRRSSLWRAMWLRPGSAPTGLDAQRGSALLSKVNSASQPRSAAASS